MQASSSGMSTPSSMPSVSISLPCRRFSRACCPSTALPRSRRRLISCSQNARISALTMPLWRKQKRYSFVLPTSDGATWAPGVPYSSSLRKTSMAMPALVPTSLSLKRQTVLYIPRRRRRWSFRDSTDSSSLRTMTPCSSANSQRNSALSSSLDKTNNPLGPLDPLNSLDPSHQ